MIKIWTDCGAFSTLYSKAISLVTKYHPYDTQLNGIICETKSSSGGLDGPENTYIGDLFDTLVMAYPIIIDNFWRIFTGWNDKQLWHVFMPY